MRTYVYLDDQPGVWFFSLDCDSAAAVFGARTLYHLPYFNADIELVKTDEGEEGGVDYSLVRTDDPPAEFEASWKIGKRLPRSEPGSLEFFLTERYCLYAAHHNQLHRARIFHEPWSLQSATLLALHSTMIEATGLPQPKGEPLLHYSEEIAVDIWPLETV